MRQKEEETREIGDFKVWLFGVTRSAASSINLLRFSLQNSVFFWQLSSRAERQCVDALMHLKSLTILLVSSRISCLFFDWLLIPIVIMPSGHYLPKEIRKLIYDHHIDGKKSAEDLFRDVFRMIPALWVLKR